jgi:RNA polymerase sigma factor (sigma-70 family)
MATNEELVAEYQGGSKPALDLLFSQNRGLIFQVALRSLKSSEHEDFEDLYQELQVVFFHSAKKFDCDRGVMFSTYALSAMKFRVIQLWTNEKRKKRTAILTSLDAPVKGTTTLLDCLQDELQCPADDHASRNEGLEKIKKAMRRLDRRSEAIVRQRMEGETLEGIARQFGVCKERVRQLEQKAFDKLRWLCGVVEEKPVVELRKTATQVVKENEDLIIRLHLAGDSPNEIAERLCVSGYTIRRRLKELGIYRDGRFAKKRKTKQERYAKRQRMKGCCRDCSKPKLEGSAYCQYHRAKRRRTVKASRARKP